MPKEIERKFLVAGDDWRAESGPGRRFEQAIVFSSGDRTVRIRMVDGDKASLTMKIGIDGSAMSRHEFEYAVPASDAAELLKLAHGNRISKTRHEVVRGDYIWEIDVYEGKLEGLVVAEVELKSEDDKPPLPSWLGRELTGDKRFSNQALAEGSLGDNWRDGLQG